MDPDDLYARLGELPPRPESGMRALTFVERELWDKAQGLPPTFANLGPAFRLRGPLDVEAFDAAVAAVVRRHDATWTTYPVVGEQPIALLDPARIGGLERADVGSEEEAIALVKQTCEAGLPLGGGPLVRFLLFRISPEEHVFLFFAHHIACDFRAVSVVARDLRSVYKAMRHGTTPWLRPLSLNNRDLAAWQARWYTGDVRGAYETFWTKQLADMAAQPPLRAMRARSTADRQSATASAAITIAPETGATLATLAAAGDVSYTMVLFAGVFAVLSGETAARSLCLGMFSANRRRETISVVGNLVVLLPVRVEVDVARSFSTHLARVNAAVKSVTDHQDAPPSASDALRGREPFRVLFNCFLASSSSVFEFDGIDVEMLVVPRSRKMLYDLELDLVIAPDQSVWVHLDYNAELIDEGAASRFLERYRRLLQRVTVCPDETIGALVAELDASEG